MLNAKNFMEIGLAFHGHKCPAMPLGLRTAVAAMNVLGVEHSQDKELHVVSETGKGHAAGCFIDGVMTATGCTYGKANIEKRYYNKMAFTLIDVKGQKSVRVSLKPDFFAKMLKSPFVEQRKQGVLPQDIAPEIADPLVERIMSLPEGEFLDIEPVSPCDFRRRAGVFEAEPCSRCKEMAFIDKMVDSEDGRICLACKEKNE